VQHASLSGNGVQRQPRLPVDFAARFYPASGGVWRDGMLPRLAHSPAFPMSFPEISSRNDVERLLADMNEGRIEPENFARELLAQQIFIPIKDDKYQIAGFQLSTKAQPLVVEDEDGNRVLIAFSSPERAKEFVAAFVEQSTEPGAGYGGGLLIETSWILRRLGAGMSLSINPGQELGFDFDTDMVAMMASLLPEESV
jgi:hypothetical protein